MTKRELIQKLEQFPDDLEIVIRDECDGWIAATDVVDLLLVEDPERRSFYTPYPTRSNTSLYLGIQ